MKANPPARRRRRLKRTCARPGYTNTGLNPFLAQPYYWSVILVNTIVSRIICDDLINVRIIRDGRTGDRIIRNETNRLGTAVRLVMWVRVAPVMATFMTATAKGRR